MWYRRLLQFQTKLSGKKPLLGIRLNGNAQNARPPRRRRLRHLPHTAGRPFARPLKHPRHRKRQAADGPHRGRCFRQPHLCHRLQRRNLQHRRADPGACKTGLSIFNHLGHRGHSLRLHGLRPRFCHKAKRNLFLCHLGRGATGPASNRIFIPSKTERWYSARNRKPCSVIPISRPRSPRTVCGKCLQSVLRGRPAAAFSKT